MNQDQEPEQEHEHPETDAKPYQKRAWNEEPEQNHRYGLFYWNLSQWTEWEKESHAEPEVELV